MGSTNVEAFVAFLVERNRPAMTVKNYRHALEQAGRAFDLDAATWREIDAWIVSRSDWTASTKRTILGALSAYYTWAQSDGRRENNPVRDMPCDRRPKAPRTQKAALPWETVEALLSIRSVGQHILSHEERAFVHLLALTGLRIGEALALRRADVDLPRALAHVRRSKNGQPRAVPIPARLLEILAPYVDSCTSERLWPRVQSWGFRLIQRIGRELGVTVHPHLLRHTWATRLIEVGFDVRTVADLLGHASTQTTTNFYVHPSPQRLADAAERAAG